MCELQQPSRKAPHRQRWLGALVAAAAFIFLADIAMAARQAPDTPTEPGTLQGRFLVAKPSMADPRFAQTVILMVKHDKTGAFGLVINKLAGVAEVSDGDTSTYGDEETGNETGPESFKIPAFYGGPVEPGKAFVIHSTDYRIDSTVAVTSTIAVTADPQILSDIADGKGPKKLLYIVGYSGWAAGQLESELRRDDWYTAPAEAGLVFGGQDGAATWRKAVQMRLQGI